VGEGKNTGRQARDEEKIRDRELRFYLETEPVHRSSRRIADSQERGGDERSCKAELPRSIYETYPLERDFESKGGGYRGNDRKVVIPGDVLGKSQGKRIAWNCVTY